MPRFHLAAATASLATAACLAPPEPSTEVSVSAIETLALALPIEVMPTIEADFTSGTYETRRTFALGATDEAALDASGTLWLQGHALGYRDGQQPRDGKASIKLNGADWVTLTNTPGNGIALDYPESAYKGIGGGFRTVRLGIDHAHLCAGAAAGDCFLPDNTIAFRFNGTDGTSSGYRIVDLDFLPAAGPGVFADDDLVTEDLDTAWGDPPSDDPDVIAGERLWRARNALYAGPGGAAMIASCSDCHAQDGADLEYFAFSDRSIIARSVFHHLTEDDGEQIAAYIRSHPARRLGRPWNPPYQPGRDHDDGDPEAWAAGQGLDAVLDREDIAMRDQIFHRGLTRQGIEEAILGVGLDDNAGTINLRKLPIAIQMPDWNSWLPEIHPLDLWGVCTWERAGDGTFAAPQQLAATTQPWDPELADVNGDGHVDLISLHPVGDYVEVRLAVDPEDTSTAELFHPPATLSPGGNLADVATADLDRDLDVDLLITDSAGDDLLVMRNDGAGDFTQVERIDAGDGAGSIATGDFDGDGDVDAATADVLGNTVTVLGNDGTGALAATSSIPVGANPAAIAAGDLDGDGVLDLAVAGYLAHRIGVLIGDGAGGFALPVPQLSGNFPRALALGDLDHDGDVDMAALSGGIQLTVMENDGAGGFTAVAYPTNEVPQQVAIADLDRDGRLDVVTVNRNSSLTVTRANVYLQQLDGTLHTPVPYDAGGPPTGIAIGDVDRDFAADLVLTTGSTSIAGALRVLSANACTAAPSHQQAPAPLVYESIRAALPALDRDDPEHLAALPDVLGKLIGSVVVFVESGWVAGEARQGGLRTVRGEVLDLAVRQGYSHELVKRSVAQWTAVKYWELMHEFTLETLGPAVYGDDGETLEWPTGGHQSVFFIAPHITSGNQDYYTDPATYPDYPTAEEGMTIPGNACVEPDCTILRHNKHTQIEGDYDSTAWYHLQMLLHAGARSRHVDPTSAVSPVDWPYVLEHIDDLPRDIGGAQAPWESLRFVASLMKLYQMRNNGMGPSLIGWSMRDVSPRILVGNWRGEADHDQLLQGLALNPNIGGSAALRLAFTEALLGVFLDVVVRNGDERFDKWHWPRLFQSFIDADDERASWFRIDMPQYAPTAGPDLGGWEFPSQQMFSHADHICRTIPRLRTLYAAAGADDAQVDELEAWGEDMWHGPIGSPNDFSVLCP